MHRDAIEALLAVRRDNVPAASFAELSGLDEAYAIQDALVAAMGHKRIGWKIGCTSRMAQEMSNTDEPFYGRMFAHSTFTSPATLAMTPLFAPIVEPEIAFRLGHDLGPESAPYDASEVLDAVATLAPAIEIVDCRYGSGWPIGIHPTVVDNGVHAAFVMGEEVSDWRAIDRPGIAVSVVVNGKTVTEGCGANALEDPLNALVWLANAATLRGHRLAAGEVITTGNAAKQAVFATQADSAVASFAELGDVRIDFA